MGASKIMIIRHAEKPASYNNLAYKGILPSGEESSKSLVTLGWERAGALVTLFAQPWGPAAPFLQSPDVLFASDPSETSEKDGEKTGDEPSQRPYQTLTAMAARLGLPINTEFSKDSYKHMLDAALDCDGTVLIAWQHQDIVHMAHHIFKEASTSRQAFPLPSKWPGDRYDIVWVFDRINGEGEIVAFTQVPQMLLSGDLAQTLPVS